MENRLNVSRFQMRELCLGPQFKWHVRPSGSWRIGSGFSNALVASGAPISRAFGREIFDQISGRRKDLDARRRKKGTRVK